MSCVCQLLNERIYDDDDDEGHTAKCLIVVTRLSCQLVSQCRGRHPRTRQPDKTSASQSRALEFALGCRV